MKRQEITLVLAKETKGTYVYAAGEEDAVITQVYLRKAQVGANAPTKIRLTVEAEAGFTGEPIDADKVLGEIMGAGRGGI